MSQVYGDTNRFENPTYGDSSTESAPRTPDADRHVGAKGIFTDVTASHIKMYVCTIMYMHNSVHNTHSVSVYACSGVLNQCFNILCRAYALLNLNFALVHTHPKLSDSITH